MQGQHRAAPLSPTSRIPLALAASVLATVSCAIGHYAVLGSKAILANNIAGRGPSCTDLTPVAHLFNAYVSVTVRPDSPLKSGRHEFSGAGKTRFLERENVQARAFLVDLGLAK